MNMDRAIQSIVAVVVVIEVINNAVTGTDTGSTLVTNVGPIVAGAGGLYALVKGFMGS